MEILNKDNMVERIFYILFIIFILVLGTLFLLKELGYMRTAVDDCIDKCSESNMTVQYDNGICKCCVHSVKSTKKETLIEDRCYEVFDINETQE